MLLPVSESNFQSSSGGLNAMEVDSTKTAKLFFMMSSTLYTDKYMSILRELCSNARDSHMTAGKLDTAIAIIAPSPGHPFLVVSDAGTGITYKDAQTSILMFLASTKDQGQAAVENIGGWGIGAKVPRAYTDNYQVHCRKGGWEWIVQVLNDAAGLPFEMLMKEGPTDRPDGVDMVVPIQPVHIRSWQEKVRRYIAMTNYNVIGYMGDGEVIRNAVPYRSYDFGNFVLDVHYNGFAPARTTIDVVYGGMVYPVPSAFETTALQAAIMERVKKGMTLVIRLDQANAIKCGLSREQMEVNEENKSLIYRAFRTIEDELKKAAFEVVGVTESQYFRSFEQIKAISDDLIEKAKANEDASRLTAISKSKQWTVYWIPPGLLQNNYKGGVRSTKVMLTLPLADGYLPEVQVVYSDGSMLRSDVGRRYAEYKLECPIKTADEQEARNWAEALEEYKGVKLQYSYQRSTKAVRESSGPRKQISYVVCAETKERITFDRSLWLVPVPHKRDLWIGEMHPTLKAFVPNSNFKNRTLPDRIRLMTKEDAIEQLDLKLTLPAEDVISILNLSSARLTKGTNGKWPEELVEDLSNLQAEMETLAKNYNHEQARFEIFKDTFGDDVSVPIVECTEYLRLLKEANRMYVWKEELADKFKVVDFPAVKAQYKEGNPEATRLLFAMNLEKFL